MITCTFSALPPLASLSLVWFLLFSGIALLLTCYDKAAAQKKGQFRIPEKTLLWIAALGGAFVMYLTMRLIRHKTLHKKFMIGLPLLFILHLGLLSLRFFL